MIPAGYVAIGAFVWGLAWIIFARIHKTPALYFFCLPIFAVAAIYAFYALVDVRIETRALIARAAILSIAASQSTILFVFSFLERERHER